MIVCTSYSDTMGKSVTFLEHSLSGGYAIRGTPINANTPFTMDIHFLAELLRLAGQYYCHIYETKTGWTLF